MKTDPCLYFFEYLPDVLKKKTKINYIGTSSPKISIRIRFHNGSGSPSLILTHGQFQLVLQFIFCGQIIKLANNKFFVEAMDIYYGCPRINVYIDNLSLRKSYN